MLCARHKTLDNVIVAAVFFWQLLHDVLLHSGSFFLCALVSPSVPVHNPLGAPYGQHNANTHDSFTMPRAHARSGAAAGSCLCPLAVAPRLCVVQVLLAAVAVAVAGPINPLYKSTLVLYHMTPAQ